MKTKIIALVFFFGLAGNVFTQVSLESFYKDWNITQEKLKSGLTGKEITDNKVKGINIISYDDVIENMAVRVDFLFNKEGLLIGKSISSLTGDKNYSLLFNLFKSDAIKRCGEKYIHKTSSGKNMLIWEPEENIRVFMSYQGLEVQYNIKRLKAKSGN